jgi:hypothetical protein
MRVNVSRSSKRRTGFVSVLDQAPKLAWACDQSRKFNRAFVA